MRWHDMGWTHRDMIGAAAVLTVLVGAWLWRISRPTRRDNRRLAAALALTAAVAAAVTGLVTATKR